MTAPTHPTPRPTRAATHARRHRQAGELRTRLGASVLTALLIVVPPAVLLQFTGNPLNPPGTLRSTSAFQQQIDDHAVVYLVALAIWLYWLHLLGCFITQTLQQAWGSNIRMPLPRLLFGANALVASHLVAAILLSGSGSTLTPAPHIPTVVSTWQPASADPTSSGTTTLPSEADLELLATAATTPARPTGAKSTAATSYISCRVLPPHGGHHDTMWGIAERHLGDGMRWRDIYALNEGRVMPDGQRLTRASLIRPGWILHLPADAIALPIDTVVHPADTDVPAIKHATTQGKEHSGVAADAPPGRHGLPAVTKAATPPQASAQATAQASEQASPPASTEVPTGAFGADLPLRPLPQVDGGEHSQQSSGPALASPSASPAPTERGTEEVIASEHPAQLRPAAAGDTQTDHQTDNQTDHQAETVAELGLLGLAALGLVAPLTRRRKVAARRRPRGTRAATPAAELLGLEAQLRREARSAQDLSAALRLALLRAAHPVGTNDPTEQGTAALVEDLIAVWHHPDDSFEFVLASHTAPSGLQDGAASLAAPPPFVPTGLGWLLPAEARRFLFATTRTKTSDDRLREALEHHDDPFPLLLPVGSHEGSACLINLAWTGAVALVGDAAAVPAVIAGWALQLAGAPWAGNCRVLLAPPYAALTTGLPTLTIAGPDDLARLTALSQPDVSTSTMAEPDADAELFVGFRPSQLPTTALELASARDTTLALLLEGEPTLDDPTLPASLPTTLPAVQPWTLHHDGTVTVPGIAEHLMPTPVDAEHLELVHRLLEHAQDPPQAATNDSGLRNRALDTPATPLPPAPIPALTNTSEPTSEPDAGLRTDQAAGLDREIAVDATTSGADGKTTASAGDNAETPASVTDMAPVEPQTVASTLQDVPPVVRVDVLGPVMMTGTTATMGGTLRQILLFLALHRRPVPPTALWEAVWPDREFNDHSLRSRCNELKRYLHRQLLKDGRSWVLPETVRCDWQEFKALAAGTTDDKVTALALVRGRPFEDFAPDWIHLEGFYSEIEATIVDLALEVATDALGRGDTMTASFAAAAGAKASPYEERLVQLGIRAAQDRGAYSLARSLHRQLSAVLDDEIDPDDNELPSTTQLMADLNYAESRQRHQANRGTDT